MATELRLPELGENIHAGDVVRVLVSEGAVIGPQQPVLEIETEKAAIEVPAAFGGRIARLLVKPGDKIKVGDVVAVVEETPAAQAAALPEEIQPARTSAAETIEPPTQVGPHTQVAPPAPEIQPPTEAPSKPVPAAPSVRRFAREVGVEIEQVTGSGPGGRISVDDVKAYAQALRSALPPTPLAAQPVEPPDFTRWGEVERLPFTNVRRVTARRVAAAWNAVPHVTQYDKADITWWEVARKQHGPRVERAGGKLTVTALLLRVIAAALRLFPKFNASLDLSREEVILKRYCHIGVAVDTERGLLAPVIRNVDHKNVTELSVELTAVSERARAGKLTLEEMQGGCFTISNLGGIGGDAFSPIVNWPEVAILGVSRAAPAPVLLDGQFVPRHLLPLSLSYDHRLIDGADGARFLRWVSEALADPFLLLLEG